MHKIEYEIGLNETGRPSIKLPDDYEDKSEDKFFALELTRYFLQLVYNNGQNTKYNEDTMIEIDRTIRLLGQIGDNMANIIWNEMRTMADLDFLTDKKYHICVNNIEERNALDEYFVNNNRIYKRQEGLKVLVTYESLNYSINSQIYVLKDGTTNENWRKVE